PQHADAASARAHEARYRRRRKRPRQWKPRRRRRQHPTGCARRRRRGCWNGREFIEVRRGMFAGVRAVTASALGAVMLCATSVLAHAAPPPTTPLRMGAAWYPEQWSEDHWDHDLALMEAAHMNVVRVGEFAWSALEPSEGHYDLDWLARAV